ncbi:hypothetical protein C8Q74DRAFT_552869 [Fomes fomentarius]|nr:hypothetical protein C8Q74DRAFT_552869 [Fomes fomentarius]
MPALSVCCPLLSRSSVHPSCPVLLSPSPIHPRYTSTLFVSRASRLPSLQVRYNRINPHISFHHLSHPYISPAPHPSRLSRFALPYLSPVLILARLCSLFFRCFLPL